MWFTKLLPERRTVFNLRTVFKNLQNINNHQHFLQHGSPCRASQFSYHRRPPPHEVLLIRAHQRALAAPNHLNGLKHRNEHGRGTTFGYPRTIRGPYESKEYQKIPEVYVIRRWKKICGPFKRLNCDPWCSQVLIMLKYVEALMRGPFFAVTSADPVHCRCRCRFKRSGGSSEGWPVPSLPCAEFWGSMGLNYGMS